MFYIINMSQVVTSFQILCLLSVIGVSFLTLFDTPALDKNFRSEAVVLVSIPLDMPTIFYNWLCIGISRGCQKIPLITAGFNSSEDVNIC